jgi:hypothetical protein
VCVAGTARRLQPDQAQRGRVRAAFAADRRAHTSHRDRAERRRRRSSFCRRSGRVAAGRVQRAQAEPADEKHSKSSDVMLQRLSQNGPSSRRDRRCCHSVELHCERHPRAAGEGRHRATTFMTKHPRRMDPNWHPRLTPNDRAVLKPPRMSWGFAGPARKFEQAQPAASLSTVTV